MYKIDLRLKTLFPAIIGTRDKHSDEDDFDEDDCSTDEDNDGDENPYAYFDTNDNLQKTYK